MDATQLVVSALCLALFATGGSAVGTQPLRILLTETVPATSAKTPAPTLYGARPNSATPLSSPSPTPLTYVSTSYSPPPAPAQYPAAGPAYFGSPEPQALVLAPVSSAATLPAVLASQMLPSYTMQTFTPNVQAQFMATLTQNVEALTGSPVLVLIDNAVQDNVNVTSGYANIETTVVFLDGNSISAARYQDALIGGFTGKVFGNGFGVVAVDSGSVSTTVVRNPSLPVYPVPGDNGSSSSDSNPGMPDNQSSPLLDAPAPVPSGTLEPGSLSPQGTSDPAQNSTSSGLDNQSPPSWDTPAPAPSSTLEPGPLSPQGTSDSAQNPSSGVLDNQSSPSSGTPAPAPSSALEPGSPGPQDTGSPSPRPTSGPGVLDDQSSSSVDAPVSTPPTTPEPTSPAPANSSVPTLSPNATQTPTAASPPPPSPSPPPPAVVLAPVTTAAVVPAVTASQTLSAYTVDTFTQDLQTQFVTTLTNNIEALSGSPVQVTINSISPGSVKVASTVAFLNGDVSSASTYQAALTSGDPAKVFGTSFGSVAVDASSVKAVTVSNPKSGAAALGISSAAATAGAAMLMMLVLA